MKDLAKEDIENPENNRSNSDQYIS